MSKDLVADKFATDAPDTRNQAEALLKQYYKEHRNEKDFPRRYNLLSWKLNDDGTMIVVDGASGRKLTFETDASKPGLFKYIEDAVDAEMDAADADTDADAAEAEAESKRKLAKQLKTNAELKAQAAKKAEKKEPEKSK